MIINLATYQRRRQTLKWLHSLESRKASLCDMSRPTFNVATVWDDSGRKTSELMIINRDLVTYAGRYTECPRRKGQNFGRVFLMLNYTDITQNTYIQS